jgi:hypothetical protein
VERDRFRIRGGAHRFNGAADQIAEIDRRDVQTKVARCHRGQVEQFLDDLHLRGGVAFDGVENRVRTLWRDRASP